MNFPKWPLIACGGILATFAIPYLLRARFVSTASKHNGAAGPLPEPHALIGNSIGVGISRHLPGVQSFAAVGYSTRNMLDVARRELRNRRFGTVIVEGHLNDMSRDSDWTISNLRQIYQAARQSGARVAGVTSTEWSGSSGWSPLRSFQRDIVDEWIVSGADGLLDRSVDLRGVSAEHAPDRLHFTNAGYRTLANALRRGIM